jgi:hypothetical protein
MVHHTVSTRREKNQIATDIMMFGTLVDPQHHATAHQSSGCPLQPSTERQIQDASPHPLLIAICGGSAWLPGVAAWIFTEKPNVEPILTRAMLRLFHFPDT